MIRLETFISNIFTFMFAKNKKNKTSADISNELLQTTKDISAHFFLKKNLISFPYSGAYINHWPQLTL